MKKGIALWLIFSVLTAGILQHPLTAYLTAKSSVTMTQLYRGEVIFESGLTVTLDSKEELCMLRDYVTMGGKTNGATFRLVQDIIWSDYEFEYHDQSQRIGIYRAHVLEAAVDPYAEEITYYKDYTSTEPIDYECGSEYWIPIDTMIGTFDGNHHTISGLWCKDESGIFRFFSGTLKNLTVSHYYLETANDYQGCILAGSVGGRGVIGCRTDHAFMLCNTDRIIGAIGDASSCVIENCVIDAVIVQNQYKGMGDSKVAILVGNSKDCMIQNNTVTGNIVANSHYCGGLVGAAKGGTIVSCKSDVRIKGENSQITGGIVGVVCGTKIEECTFGGGIRIEGESLHVGGIAGYSGEDEDYSSRNSNTIITDCTNCGRIMGGGHSGGILGICATADATLISNCTNTGAVYSRSTYSELCGGSPSAGGILGAVRYDLYSAVEKRIVNCVNKGTICAIPEDGSAGGILCDMGRVEYNKVTVQNCYNAGKVSATNLAGELAGVFRQGRMENCYYVNTGDNPPIAESSVSIDQSRLYGITESQLLGTETESLIAQDGYAACYTLREALNAWIVGEGAAECFGWKDNNNGPSIRIGYTLVTPTPTPTKKPVTHKPSVTEKPTAIASQIPEPSVTPQPTGNLPAATQTPASGVTKKEKKAKKSKAPVFTLKKKRTASGKRYVQIRLKRYQGTYVEIKVRKKGKNKKFYKLKIKNNHIRKSRNVFNFRYTRKRGILEFKIRTYVKKGKKRIYSYESKKKRIRLS